MSNEIYKKQGLVGVTLWQLRSFAHDTPVGLAVYLLDPYNEEVEDGRSHNFVPQNGAAEVSKFFKLRRDMQHKAAVLQILTSGDEVLSQAEVSLETVLATEYMERQWIQLEPRGEVEIEMVWVSAPETPTKYFQISNLSLSKLVRPNIDPYIIVVAENEELGRTETHAGGNGHISFQFSLERPYTVFSDLTFMVCDEAEGDENPVAEKTIDVWGLFKRSSHPCRQGSGDIEDLTGQFAGVLGVRLDFFDDEAEKLRKPDALSDSTEHAAAPAERKLSLPFSTAGSDMSSEEEDKPVANRALAPPPVSPERRRALDEAQRAADAAEKEAAKAKDMARDVAEAPMVAPEAKDNVRQAEAAADTAAAAARRARAGADDLAAKENMPNSEFERALKNVTDAARDAKDAREKTRLKAKDAASISAREDAKAAKASARKAARCRDDVKALAATYPNVRQFDALCAEADAASQEADMEAAEAKEFADLAEQSPKLADALAHARRTREAAVRAREQEVAAEEILKRAQALGKKADRATERLNQKRLEDEENAARRARQAQEAIRDAEHEADMARRRATLTAGVGNAEPDLYQSAATLAFHRDLKSAEDLAAPAANWNVCCSSAPPLDRRGSESLHGAIPAYELRGLDMPTKQPTASFPLLENGGILEAKLAGRPQCWCFGCGCMRCCGEC